MRGLGLAAALASGCSLVFAHVPEQRDERGHLDCPSVSPPTDVVMSGLYGLYSLASLAASSDPDTLVGPGGERILAAVGGALAIGFALSAWHGYSVKAKCKRLDADPSYGIRHPLDPMGQRALRCDGSPETHAWVCNTRLTFRARCDDSDQPVVEPCASGCIPPGAPSLEAECGAATAPP